MRVTLYLVCFVSACAVVSAVADAGQFIPKAFYTLDAEGQKSEVHPVSPHTAHYLRRLRRQTFSSSSSSSSSVSTDGGPTFFSSQQTVHQSPGVAPSIASRFGGSDAPAGATGFVTQTTGVIDPSGRVTYKTQQGHF